MLSRRHFLVSSGTVLLASLARSRASEPESVPLRLHACVITDPDLPECCTFETVTHSATTRVHIDTGDYLAELAAIIDRQAPELIVGFTRHSDFVVLSQIAFERGFAPSYREPHACPAGHRLLSWGFRGISQA
jgi:hypothetical protein